ncbi:sigma-E processing peptidase SpoIIGA [Falsibacillus albus]|uniref:Sporulation sigma-E factor-processing peptidase n=1 Tax=Falsibacillus albus TaxID=2478915 RepID=A0A3L7JYK2_9BACI|nr:sigma-E processing peptidase SpoIIGA [Falsibacillus albus]RLQ95823.1 sigma-E processing peptidase SpoIIGA [Falsibacillus albus]
MVIYLDVIWLLNLLVDSLILWMTSLILKRHVPWWRVLLGGFIGSLIILLPITPWGGIANDIWLKLSFSLMMVLAVFGFKRAKYYLSNLMTFYFSTFLIGGILMGTHYLLSFQLDYQSSIFLASVRGFGDPISWLFVIFGIPAAWYFSKKRIETFEMAKIQYDQIVLVSIELNGLKFTLKGLIDSGNKLTDPISQMPVMIVSIKSLQEHLPSPIVSIARDPDAFMDGTIQLPDEWRDRLRFVPAQVVGKQHQLLSAFKPDFIKISNQQETWTIKKALISFTVQPLSQDDEFDCIVHPKMLTGISVKTAS